MQPASHRDSHTHPDSAQTSGSVRAVKLRPGCGCGYTEKSPNAWQRRGTQKTRNIYNQPNRPSRQTSQTKHQALPKGQPARRITPINTAAVHASAQQPTISTHTTTGYGCVMSCASGSCNQVGFVLPVVRVEVEADRVVFVLYAVLNMSRLGWLQVRLFLLCSFRSWFHPQVPPQRVEENGPPASTARKSHVSVHLSHVGLYDGSFLAQNFENK